MNNCKDNAQYTWAENVIIVDGDYIDSVAFDMTVNFERIIGRRIPKADLAKWIDCVALDGGIRPGDNQTKVVFIHGRTHKELENFTPGDYEDEICGKAFLDNLGEFELEAYPESDFADTDRFIAEIISIACSEKQVKRIIIVPNTESPELMGQLNHVLRNVDDEKRITLLTMSPKAGGNFRQEILGYSLMCALGIKSDEIKTDD